MSYYTLKTIPANPGNYGGSRAASDIKYLVIHYTGNDGATARENALYFQSTVVKASAHYFVDDTEVYQSVPDLSVAWAVGGTKYASCAQTGGGTLYGAVTNGNSISVELCDIVRDRAYSASEATLQTAAQLCRKLMERYGIPLERVVRHFDVTGKLCPAYMVEDSDWAAFKRRLVQQDLDNTPAPAHADGVTWAIQTGILQGNESGDYMLSQPVTRQQLCTMLYRFWKYLKKQIQIMIQEILKKE